MKDSPLSPIDDRYYEEVRELTPFFSQESLVQERARIELEYLSFLMRVGVAPSSKIPALEVSYEEVKPVYKEMKPLFHAEMTHGRLPSAVESLIELLEDQLKARVTLVSYGEERSRTIER